MTSAIEHGLAAFITAFLADRNVTAAVHAGTSGELLPTTEPVVIVSVKEARHEVGPLYTGDVELIVATRAVATNDVEVHRNLVAAVEQAFDPANSAAISAAVQTTSGCTVQGWFSHGPKDSQEDERWHTTLPVSLGLQR